MDTRAAGSADSRYTRIQHKDHSFSSLLMSRVKCHTKGGIVWKSISRVDLFLKPAHILVIKMFLLA